MRLPCITPWSIEKLGLDLGGRHVHVGTGGAAVHVLHSDGNTHRPSRLCDLYRMMRVLDACPNIHYGVRPLVTRDVEDTFELDVNTAYACLRATAKPLGVSFERKLASSWTATRLQSPAAHLRPSR